MQSEHTVYELLAYDDIALWQPLACNSTSLTRSLSFSHTNKNFRYIPKVYWIPSERPTFIVSMRFVRRERLNRWLFRKLSTQHFDNFNNYIFFNCNPPMRIMRCGLFKWQKSLLRVSTEFCTEKKLDQFLCTHFSVSAIEMIRCNDSNAVSTSLSKELQLCT